MHGKSYVKISANNNDSFKNVHIIIKFDSKAVRRGLKFNAYYIYTHCYYVKRLMRLPCKLYGNELAENLNTVSRRAGFALPCASISLGYISNFTTVQ